MLMVFMGIYCSGYVEDKWFVTVGSKTIKVSVQVLLISVLSHNGGNDQAQGCQNRTIYHKVSCKNGQKEKG